jgi:nucleotide-binding universal stress UspA family protein
MVDVVCVATHGPARLRWLDQPLSEPLRSALEGLRRDELLAASQVANAAGERLQRLGFTIHAWAREGDPIETILASIEAGHPDLVLVGPAGRSGLATSILGSVTQRIVARAVAPILVARPAADTSGPLPRHILLVVDGTPVAEAALAWLMRTGWLVDGRLTLLGVLGRRTGLGPGETTEGEVGALVRGEAIAMLERLAQPVSARAASVGLELRGGHPLQAVLDAVDKLGVDLVVVARTAESRGSDGLAERVARHTTASVLLVTTEG